MASEEMDGITVVPNRYPKGEYLLLFDPLDGSSATSTSTSSIGTIFSVLQEARQPGVSEDDFLQPGWQQAAAGYCVYGPQTTLVLTVGDGVAMFTLDRERAVGCSPPTVQIPADTKEFAINMSQHAPLAGAGEALHRRMPWPARNRRAGKGLQHALGGQHGGRRAPHPDARRRLHVPWDKREPEKPGKLRLSYEGQTR